MSKINKNLQGKIFKAKLLDTTNDNVKKYIGEIRNCALSDNLYMVRGDGHYISTSSTKKLIPEKDDELVVLTLNSTYRLKIVESQNE